MASGDSSCDCIFWDKRGGELTGQPVGPTVGTTTMTAVMSAKHVDWGLLSHDDVRSGVHKRAQTLFGYIVFD